MNMRAGNTHIKYVPCIQDVYRLVGKTKNKTKEKKNRLIKTAGESVRKRSTKAPVEGEYGILNKRGRNSLRLEPGRASCICSLCLPFIRSLICSVVNELPLWFRSGN